MSTYKDEFIAKIRAMSDAELKDLLNDCRASYEANWQDPDAERYVEESICCNQEIYRRELLAWDAAHPPYRGNF
tara:strand:+ start:675 stop:896 length:222 start_codon:yes stop_codon:yes gene_type:complete